jgi:diguanylate cyclase (GGDEF)-like protein
VTTNRLRWRRVRRPENVIESTRWLFVVLALVSLLLALPAPLGAAHVPSLLAAAACAAVLILSWIVGYLRRSAPLVIDVVDAVAILGFTLACPQPSAALGFIFAALWFRALYGSTGRAVLRCILYSAALVAALPMWTLPPDHALGTAPGPVIGAIPTMFLTVVVGRYLAGSLHARERAARLDAVHVSLGSNLLGVTDAAEIRRIAWKALTAVCEVNRGVRVLKLVRDGAELRTDGATGGFREVPSTMDASVLTLLGGDDCPSPPQSTARGRAVLDAAVGTACVWTALPMPNGHEQHGRAWLMVGSPGPLASEVVTAIASLENQVTLALQNSEVHQKLTDQATLDGLTGLANRPSFNAALAAALGTDGGEGTTVLFIDLDDFKDVNDQLGHRAGDDLLREVAARLRQATRPSDLCARLGGDEFAVLLRSTNTDTACDVAQRVVRAVSAPVQLSAGLTHVGASVGVATATCETGPDQLVQQADVAMYAAKANGKARVQLFAPGLLRGDSSQVRFERQLAVAAAAGELVVHYQPVLSLPGRRCTAAEALVRWQHPEQGLLYPDRFIDAAERSGAIHALGAWVLRQACSDLARWRRAHPGSPLAVHVNVSAMQLDNDGFYGAVTRCLKEFGLPPESLVLEITETVVIGSRAAIDQLNALADYGVVIAIDDFGTGYSALTTLRSLPVQIVKIDKSFISGSTVNTDDRAVTEAVVNMAARMGMKSIAEGVESIDQERFLASIGADAVQGYLYLRPAAASEFETWLGVNLARGTSKDVADHDEHDDRVLLFKPRHTA